MDGKIFGQNPGPTGRHPPSATAELAPTACTYEFNAAGFAPGQIWFMGSGIAPASFRMQFRWSAVTSAPPNAGGSADKSKLLEPMVENPVSCRRVISYDAKKN